MTNGVMKDLSSSLPPKATQLIQEVKRQIDYSRDKIWHLANDTCMFSVDQAGNL